MLSHTHTQLVLHIQAAVVMSVTYKSFLYILIKHRFIRLMTSAVDFILLEQNIDSVQRLHHGILILGNISLGHVPGRAGQIVIHGIKSFRLI